jgi:hypothetical protein
MSCRILESVYQYHTEQVFVDSVTDTAFGPLMFGDAEEFEEWLVEDPRTFTTDELVSKYNEFRNERE